MKCQRIICIYLIGFQLEIIGYNEIYKTIDKKAKNVKVFTFDDVTEFQFSHNIMHPFYKIASDNRGLIYFDHAMAKQIKQFAEQIWFKHLGELNIHCYAGKSRSQAIASSLNTYINLFLSHNKLDYLYNIQKFNVKHHPNPEILQIMNKALYL